MFVQKDLAATLRKLVEAEKQALKRRQDEKAGDLRRVRSVLQGRHRAARSCAACRRTAGCSRWRTSRTGRCGSRSRCTRRYKGIEVYKLPMWQQGPAMLQALNILENTDVKSMEYNSPKYIHSVYQAMNLAFADRDFYYGDPYFPPEEPVKGLLSKEYAKARFARSTGRRTILTRSRAIRIRSRAERIRSRRCWRTGRTVTSCCRTRSPRAAVRIGVSCQRTDGVARTRTRRSRKRSTRGTTSIEAADEEGWVVSVTPSGGWVPAVIAGRTGIGLSQRAQSFVTDAKDGPFNVIEPGKRPRVTLTPTLALKDGEPYLAFAVQGGDSQDQNLLQFFLNVVEFGMTVQQAVEAPNINSFQMRSSFGAHEIAARPHDGRVVAARGDSSGASTDGLHAGRRGADVRPDQRDHVRSKAPDDVGRLEQSRRGLRDRVVTSD